MVLGPEGLEQALTSTALAFCCNHDRDDEPDEDVDTSTALAFCCNPTRTVHNQPLPRRFNRTSVLL